MEYHIVISGTIGSWWGNSSADYVRYVLSKYKDKEVHVGFCSLGGFVKDGLEIYQAFRDHGNVHAHAFGMNASISTIAMLGCKTIDIVKGSFFLIHNVSVWIEKYEQTNKEELDAYIKKLQSTQGDLKTFDEVLGNMYAEKTGKTLDECLEQMKKGTWMTAQQAKDFGLVDDIREDKEAQKASAQYNSQFVNSYSTIFKDAGIPPLPEDKTDDMALSDISDGNGNPTKSFVQKTWHELRSLFRNQQAEPQQQMNKVFKNIMELLACSEGFKPQDDGLFQLSDEQMTKINSQLEQQNKKLSENAEAIEKSEKEIENLKKTIADRDKTIENLKAGPGDKTEDKPINDAETFTASDIYKSIQNI